jgi:hypothetical protein
MVKFVPLLLSPLGRATPGRWPPLRQAASARINADTDVAGTAPPRHPRRSHGCASPSRHASPGSSHSRGPPSPRRARIRLGFPCYPAMMRPWAHPRVGWQRGESVGRSPQEAPGVLASGEPVPPTPAGLPPRPPPAPRRRRSSAGPTRLGAGPSRAPARQEGSTPQEKQPAGTRCAGVWPCLARTTALPSRALGAIAGGRAGHRAAKSVTGSGRGHCMDCFAWGREGHRLPPGRMPSLPTLDSFSWRLCRGAGRIIRCGGPAPWPPATGWSGGMAYAPTRRVACPSRERNGVCTRLRGVYDV